MNQAKFVFLDRDGTINVRPPTRCYVTSREGFTFLPRAIDAMKLLASSGYSIILVTNQAGVGRGLMSESDLEDIHRYMAEELEKEGVELLDIFACTDSHDSGSLRRKPHPTMFYEARDRYSVDLADCFYVGDDNRDMLAANNAGMKSIFVGDPDSLTPPGSDAGAPLVCDDLYAAAQLVVNGVHQSPDSVG